MKYLKFFYFIPIIYIDLFFEFFKIGLFAVGGGFATIPYLYNLTYKFQWISVKDVSDMVGVATVLPGPIGVSCATFIGWKAAGLLGGIIGALGLITPSVIVIIIVAKLFMKVEENKYVQNVFYGLRPIVCGLIAACAYTFLKHGVMENGTFHYKPIIIFIVSILCMTFIKKIHPAFYIILGAFVGIVFKL